MPVKTTVGVVIANDADAAKRLAEHRAAVEVAEAQQRAALAAIERWRSS